MKLIWMKAGPRAGELLEFPDTDADQAIEQGWGTDAATGRLPYAQRGPHAMADAYFAARPGYTIRELRAGKPPALPPSQGPAAPAPSIDMPPPPVAPVAPASGETTPTKAMAPSTKRPKAAAKSQKG